MVGAGIGMVSLLGLILAGVQVRSDEIDTEERVKRAVPYSPYGGYGGPPRPAVAPYGGPMAPAMAVEGMVPAAPPPPPLPPGQCPGGPSLGKQCDAKRPWPQCPPDSYCYAVNSVDIGPYYCCPVWSTMGAQWRPAAPFYPYYPPMPFNWPYVIQATAHWGAQTSPASGWLGQFGPPPAGPVGPVGGAVVAPGVPEGPYAGPGPLPGPGPFEKRKKETDTLKAEHDHDHDDIEEKKV